MTSSVLSEMAKLLVGTILEADDLLDKGQFDESFKVLTAILFILDRFDEYPELDHFKGHIYERKGRLLLEWKVYNAALLMFIKALDRYSIQDDILGQACVYGNIGMCHQALGDKYKAIEYYLEHVILSSKHSEPDKLESMDSTTPVDKLAIKYLATALNIAQAIDEKLGLINHSNRLNWFSLMNENYVKALELCRYHQPISFFKQLSSSSTESNLAARLKSLHNNNIDSFASSSYLGDFLQVSTLAKINSNFFLEAVSATNIAHTSLYIGDYNKAIQTANSAISLFLSYRHICTLDQLPDSFDEEERKAYAWLILAQVKSKLHFDALLSCEKYRYQMLAKITNNHGFSQLELHLFDVSKLKDILVALRLTTLYYHVIQFEDLKPQLIIWLVQPQRPLSPLLQKKETEIDIKCHIVDLPSYNIGDVRDWVVQCRYALEFSGYSTSSSNNIDDDRRRSPQLIPPCPNTSSALFEDLPYTDTSNCRCMNFLPNNTSSHQGTATASSSSLPNVLSISSLNSLSTQISQQLSSTSSASNSNSTSSSPLTLFIQSILLLAAGGLLVLFSPLILLVETFRFLLIIFISVSNNQLFVKILRIINDHLQLQRKRDTSLQPIRQQYHAPPSLTTLLTQFFGVTSTTNVIHKLHSKYLSRQTVADKRNCDNTATNACQSMYDVLFMVFESELSDYEDGLDLAIVTHDILGLVPFSALMDSKGIYLINKYKLRSVPSIFMIWDLYNSNNLLTKGRKSRSRKRHRKRNDSFEMTKNEPSYPYPYDHDIVTNRLLVGGRRGASVVPVVDGLRIQKQCDDTICTHTPEGSTSSTIYATPTDNQSSMAHSLINKESNIEITSLTQYLFDRRVLQLPSAKRSTVKACVLNLDLSPKPREGIRIPVAHIFGDNNTTAGTCEVNSPQGGSGSRCHHIPTIRNTNAAEIFKLFKNASEELRPDVVILRSCFWPTQRGGGQGEGATFEWLDGIVRALHGSGIPCVIFAITELGDSDAALSIINHFYQALLGITEQDITAGNTPLDSIEALQAAVFRQMFKSDNYGNPCQWSGLVLSGIPVDMRGRTR